MVEERKSTTFSIYLAGQGAIQQDTRTFRIVARAANQAPVLAPIGARTLTEGQAFELHLNAVDPDGDMLTYRANTLPGSV